MSQPPAFSNPFLLAALGIGTAAAFLSPSRPRSRSEWLASFSSWAGPASVTEEEKLARTERMVAEALLRSRHLAGYELDIFPHGSSTNNTNTKRVSDLDLVVLNTETWSLPARGDVLPYSTPIRSFAEEYSTFKERVSTALQEALGWLNIDAGNKCLKVRATETTRVFCDVLPCFRLRQYHPRNPGMNSASYDDGVIFRTANGDHVVSYPEQHLWNGRAKNVATGYRYKQVVRVLKRFKANFQEAQTLLTSEPLPPSFEIESVVYNVPNAVLTRGDLFDAVEGTLRWICVALDSRERCNALKQPNSINQLFPIWSDTVASLLSDGTCEEPEEVVRFKRFAQRALGEITPIR